MHNITLYLARVIDKNTQQTAGYHSSCHYSLPWPGVGTGKSQYSEWDVTKEKDWHLQDLASKVNMFLSQHFSQAKIDIEIDENACTRWIEPYVSTLCHPGDDLKLLEYPSFPIKENSSPRIIAP